MQRLDFVVVILLLTLGSVSANAQGKGYGAVRESNHNKAGDLLLKEKYAAAMYRYDNQSASSMSPVLSVSNEDACFYAAVSAAKLDNNDAPYRLQEFLRLYPWSRHCNMARFHLGNFYYARKDYKKALGMYSQVEGSEVEYGSRSEYDFKRAYCLFLDGNSAQAKDIFARIGQSKSKYKNSALYYYAHIQYQDKEYDLALKNFEKLKNDKKFASIVPSYEARIYYYMGREDDLLNIAPSLLQQKDVFRKYEIAQMVAEVYYNRGDYPQALKYYEQVEQLQNENPNDGGVCTPQDNHYQMGYCYYQQKRYKDAATRLRKKTQCSDSVAQNALYILGDCYVKLGDKPSARSAFLQASQMSYDKAIKEDALFNYAKLSCELKSNPYNESIRSFQNYLATYPNSRHKTEVQEILAGLYMTTRNYKDALTLIEKIEDKNATLNEAYQRIVLNRGIELFNTGDIEEADTYFSKAVKINAKTAVTTDALYLHGEALYRLGNLDQADRQLDRFLLSSGAKKSNYYSQGLYSYGYVCMKQKRYDDAATYFSDYLLTVAAKTNARQRCDAYNRLGDCSYIRTRYNEAINYYDQNITEGAYEGDYAMYQKALCYGALGKSPEKLSTLNRIFEQYKGSSYCAKATLETASTYMVLGNNEMALLHYDKFIKEYPKSAHVKRALLSQGQIYYNMDKNAQALQKFDQLITQYPATEEAKDALAIVKNIYVDDNRVDEYFAYVKRKTKTNVSALEQDSTTFEAARLRYMDGDCESSVKGMQNYLAKFPDGVNQLTAHYYLADCLLRLGRNSEALPHYEQVSKANGTQYTETATLHSAQIAYSLNDYSKALRYFSQLSQSADNERNRQTGRVGKMRCLVHLGQHQEVMTAAQLVVDDSSTTPELRDEALIAMARSSYSNGITESAKEYYGRLQSSSNGDYSGEASYYLAEMMFAEGNIDKAEKQIELIVADPHSDYWLAKSFILWADIFAARDNKMQAKQTLLSIIENYDGADLVSLAQQKYDLIVEQEKTSTTTEEPETVIDITE